MNTYTAMGIALFIVGLFLPVEWALVPWFTGVSLMGYGHGVAAGERDMRRLWRGGE